jgi:hypothetical protein
MLAGTAGGAVEIVWLLAMGALTGDRHIADVIGRLEKSP